MYKLPKLFSQEITRRGKLTSKDYKDLKTTPEEFRKIEARWNASKNLLKETSEAK